MIPFWKRKKTEEENYSLQREPMAHFSRLIVNTATALTLAGRHWAWTQSFLHATMWLRKERKKKDNYSLQRGPSLYRKKSKQEWLLAF